MVLLSQRALGRRRGRATATDSSERTERCQRMRAINGRSFRPQIELLRQRAPRRLLLTNELRGGLGRVGAADRKPQREEPLLDIGIAQELADVPVQLRDDIGGRAGRSDHDQPAVQLEARQRFSNRRQIVEAGETLGRTQRDASRLAGTREASTAANKLSITCVVPTDVSCIICAVVR